MLKLENVDGGHFDWAHLDRGHFDHVGGNSSGGWSDIGDYGDGRRLVVAGELGHGEWGDYGGSGGGGGIGGKVHDDGRGVRMGIAHLSFQKLGLDESGDYGGGVHLGLVHFNLAIMSGGQRKTPQIRLQQLDAGEEELLRQNYCLDLHLRHVTKRSFGRRDGH